jgi:hypothetical protein
MNPNIIAIAENMKAHPNIKTACDYLNAVRELLKKHLLIKFNFLDECHEIAMNGQIFATQTNTLKIMNLPLVKQTEYAKMAKNGYILFFSLTYFNRMSKNNLDNVMRNLKFSQQ